jgi:hypothetical protein
MTFYYVCIKHSSVMFCSKYVIQVPTLCPICGEKLLRTDQKPLRDDTEYGFKVKKKSKKYYDCVQFATLLGEHPRKVQRWAKEGSLGGARKNPYSREWEIPQETLEAVLQEKEASRL